MSLQGRFALVPAGVSKWVTILATFLCKFLAGGSCHILMVQIWTQGQAWGSPFLVETLFSLPCFPEPLG